MLMHPIVSNHHPIRLIFIYTVSQLSILAPNGRLTLMNDGVVDSFFSNPEGTFFPIPSSVTEIPVVIQAGTQVILLKGGTKVDYPLSVHSFIIHYLLYQMMPPLLDHSQMLIIILEL